MKFKSVVLLSFASQSLGKITAAKVKPQMGKRNFAKPFSPLQTLLPSTND
jgi:hypothetical protein